jgi:hypothetical protein
MGSQAFFSGTMGTPSKLYAWAEAAKVILETFLPPERALLYASGILQLF